MTGKWAKMGRSQKVTPPQLAVLSNSETYPPGGNKGGGSLLKSSCRVNRNLAGIRSLGTGPSLLTWQSYLTPYMTDLVTRTFTDRDKRTGVQQTPLPASAPIAFYGKISQVYKPQHDHTSVGQALVLTRVSCEQDQLSSSPDRYTSQCSQLIT